MIHLWNIADDVPQTENEIVLETYDPIDTACNALTLLKEKCKENKIMCE